MSGKINKNRYKNPFIILTSAELFLRLSKEMFIKIRGHSYLKSVKRVLRTFIDLMDRVLFGVDGLVTTV